MDGGGGDKNRYYFSFGLLIFIADYISFKFNIKNVLLSALDLRNNVIIMVLVIFLCVNNATTEI